MTDPETFDLAIIGGGINGVAIAADAAGRGLSVCLFEQADLASGTSSASSKLIHGGLRYLEHYEFSLVRESLAEREVLLNRAPHIVWPLRFVLPQVPGLRPTWMIRAGLFLYDHLYRRRLIPGSRSLDLRRDPAGQPLAPHLTRGFAYWDCWVDDSRLVILTARDAADRGAHIFTRTPVDAVTRNGDRWRLDAHDAASGAAKSVTARTLVNAAGPWVDHVAGLIVGGRPSNTAPRGRLVKGSHIVVPRIAGATDAYLMQNADGRVVFALPFEDDFTLIGTTDIPFSGDPATAACSVEEEQYLLALANQFFRAPLSANDIVWHYAGVRSLYDDGTADPSAVSRDYHLALDTNGEGPALLSVYGGKVTTHRRLAEDALAYLAPHLPPMRPPWTAKAVLPGGDLPSSPDAHVDELHHHHPGIPLRDLRRLARCYGTQASEILGSARDPRNLGKDVGFGLSEREIAHLRDREWARTADDILWRRTKLGLHAPPDEREAFAEQIEAALRA